MEWGYRREELPFHGKSVVVVYLNFSQGLQGCHSVMPAGLAEGVQARPLLPEVHPGSAQKCLAPAQQTEAWLVKHQVT